MPQGPWALNLLHHRNKAVELVDGCPLCVCMCVFVHERELTNEVLLLWVVLVKHLQESDLNEGLVVEGLAVLYDLDCNPVLFTMIIGLYNLWTQEKEQRGGREEEEREKRGEKRVEGRGGRGELGVM